MDIQDTRISKIREYMIGVIDELVSDEKYTLGTYNLDSDPNNYSLDKMPTDSNVEKWINGVEIHRDVYSFRARTSYSQDYVENLKNIGFFETFEKTIKEKNDKKELPNIDNVESIECLNCGALSDAQTETAIFDIQIQVTYRIGG